jgi:carbon starvation protein
VHVVLFKMKRERYAWVTLLPTAWLLICTMTAGWQKIFTTTRKSASSKNIDQMHQIILNNQIDAGMAALFLFLVVSILAFTIPACRKALGQKQRTDQETPYVAVDPALAAAL